MIAASRRPTNRAGSRKAGTNTRDSTVTCQESENITPAVRTRGDDIAHGA